MSALKKKTISDRYNPKNIKSNDIKEGWSEPKTYWYTGFSSQIGTKLRDWAVGQALGSCYCWAALSSNDSKTL